MTGFLFFLANKNSSQVLKLSLKSKVGASGGLANLMAFLVLLGVLFKICDIGWWPDVNRMK
jgi:hypothetical protein